MRLWLDDVRPAPVGWEWVTNIADAKRLLETGQVEQASLDHDLGACETCLNATPDWRGVMPHCSHIGTGYDLCLWMAEHNIWPKQRPVVHSMNTDGRDRMRGVITRYFPVMI